MKRAGFVVDVGEGGGAEIGGDGEVAGAENDGGNLGAGQFQHVADAGIEQQGGDGGARMLQRQRAGAVIERERGVGIGGGVENYLAAIGRRVGLAGVAACQHLRHGAGAAGPDVAAAAGDAVNDQQRGRVRLEAGGVDAAVSAGIDGAG